MELNENDFFKVKALGGGSFANVYLITNKKTNEQYALKEFKPHIEVLSSADILELIEKEIKILCKLDYPTIIKIRG